MQKLRSILNNNLQVSFDVTNEVLLIQQFNPAKIKQFAGYPQLDEQYNDYENSFTEQTDFEATVKFFTPNFLQTFL